MKLTINQKELTKALTAATRVAPARTNIPILSHIHFDATSSNKVAIRATDLDIEITINTEAKVEQGGEMCVPAGAFRDIANKLNGGADVSLEFDASRLTIKSGRSKFNLNTLSADDWPDITADETQHRFDIASDAIGRMFASTAFAISTEETRYYLGGIFFHVSGIDQEARLRGVATDGHRLSRYDVALPPQAKADMPGVIIPRKTVAEVDRFLKDAPETINIGLSTKFIRFDLGSMVISSKIIDGSFPDYARVIPSDVPMQSIVDSAALSASVARVSTVASDKGRAVKMSFNGSSLTTSVYNPDMGEAIDEIDCEWPSQEKFEVGFNSRYVQECLDILGDGPVSLKFKDPGAPCVMCGKDDALLIVLMPMRV